MAPINADDETDHDSGLTPSFLTRSRARWDKMAFFRKLKSLPDDEVLKTDLSKMSNHNGKDWFFTRNPPRTQSLSNELIQQDVCNINDSPRRLIKVSPLSE
jgi:hypothetical protein